MVDMTQEEFDQSKRKVGDVSKHFDFSTFKQNKYYTENTKSNDTRPIYYGGKGNPYEVFNVLEAWQLDKDFYLGNVIKYVARAGKKDPSKTKEDLQKALVYLQRRIDQL
jgi:hypothetical protein